MKKDRPISKSILCKFRLIFLEYEHIPRVILVSGANRGIGLEICKSILQTVTTPVILYAASRAGNDLGLKPSSSATVQYPSLDISSPESINALSKKLSASHPKGISILINNAGVNLDDEYNAQNAQTTIDVNYHGTLNMCKTFLPLLSLQTGSRLVNVSSTASSLSGYAPEIQAQFRDREQSLSDLDSLMAKYESILSNGTTAQQGWPAQQAYKVSKAGINAMTRILARDNPKVLVNCCCPGWVDTDMGKMVGKPAKTLEEGARIPVRLAVGDIGGVSGEYWGNLGVADKGWGEVRPW